MTEWSNTHHNNTVVSRTAIAIRLSINTSVPALVVESVKSVPALPLEVNSTMLLSSGTVHSVSDIIAVRQIPLLPGTINLSASVSTLFFQPIRPSGR